MRVSHAKHIKGTIIVPGDKSISHRAAIISSLTNDSVNIRNYLYSLDCISTLNVLKSLGVKIEKVNNDLIIHGRGIESYTEPEDVLFVGNSGTTIRLMAGIASACDFMSVFTGDKSINNRPMSRIIEPLTAMGAKIYGRNLNRNAPLVIIGKKKLEGSSFKINISSAQVKSCITLAGLFADGPTEIVQPAVSRDHTERMLEYFEADIKYNGKTTKINPGKDLKGKNLFIPGDISSAAYFIVAGLITEDSMITIKDAGINPTRNYFLTVLKNMGANIEIQNERVLNNEPVADIKACSSKLKGIKINPEYIANIIDDIPILCVAAAFADGTTYISGAAELRLKESDRLHSISSQFAKAGVSLIENADGLIINGNKNLKIRGGYYESFSDHRIAMALAILGLKSKEQLNINDFDCVETSFPGFKYELKKIIS